MALATDQSTQLCYPRRCSVMKASQHSASLSVSFSSPRGCSRSLTTSQYRMRYDAHTMGHGSDIVLPVVCQLTIARTQNDQLSESQHAYKYRWYQRYPQLSTHSVRRKQIPSAVFGVARSSAPIMLDHLCATGPFSPCAMLYTLKPCPTPSGPHPAETLDPFSSEHADAHGATLRCATKTLPRRCTRFLHRPTISRYAAVVLRGLLEPVLSAFQREGLSGRHLSVEVLTDVCLGGQLFAHLRSHPSKRTRCVRERVMTTCPATSLSTPRARGLAYPPCLSRRIDVYPGLAGCSFSLGASARHSLPPGGLIRGIRVLAGVSASRSTQASPGAACSP